MSNCRCGRLISGAGPLCPYCSALQELGLMYGASAAEIRQAYLLYVRAWHPDRFPGDEKAKRAAQEKLKAINAAYGLLSGIPPIPTNDTSKRAPKQNQETDKQSKSADRKSPPPSSTPTPGSAYYVFLYLGGRLRTAFRTISQKHEKAARSSKPPQQQQRSRKTGSSHIIGKERVVAIMLVLIAIWALFPKSGPDPSPTYNPSHASWQLSCDIASGQLPAESIQMQSFQVNGIKFNVPVMSETEDALSRIEESDDGRRETTYAVNVMGQIKLVPFSKVPHVAHVGPTGNLQKLLSWLPIRISKDSETTFRDEHERKRYFDDLWAAGKAVQEHAYADSQDRWDIKAAQDRLEKEGKLDWSPSSVDGSRDEFAHLVEAKLKEFRTENALASIEENPKGEGTYLVKVNGTVKQVPFSKIPHVTSVSPSLPFSAMNFATDEEAIKYTRDMKAASDWARDCAYDADNQRWDVVIAQGTAKSQSNVAEDKSNRTNDDGTAAGRTAISIPTGTELRKRRKLGGLGELSVENGSDSDAVVHLVDSKRMRPVRTFYIRHGESFKERGISVGQYLVYFATGSDWNRDAKAFNISPSYSEFGKSLDFTEDRDEETGKIEYAIYSITLQPVAGGDVRANPATKEEWDRLMADSDKE